MDIYCKRIERTLKELKSKISIYTENLFPVLYKECGYKSDNTLPKNDGTWQTMTEKNARLGGYDRHFWIYKKFKTPDRFDNGRICLNFVTDINKKEDASRHLQCVLYVNGELVQGLDKNHTLYELQPGTSYEIYIYVYTGMYKDSDYRIGIKIKVIDTLIEQLYYDMLVPFETAKCFEEGSYERDETLKHLCASANFLTMGNENLSTFAQCCRQASNYLAENYYGKYERHPATIDCIGHTHIDVAWLWTYAQTREKVQRSFSLVIRLMEKFPEYKFMISQPQLLEFLQEESPELYAELKKYILAGRIEVEGAMWVESDCNLISGESMVRQVVFGKEFLMNEFGVDSKILWLPDAFGFSASMPQIMKLLGIEKFVTSKISWNEFDKMPYDIFNWQGIDGSSLKTYFITGQDINIVNGGSFQTTYTGTINPEFMLGTWKRFQQKKYSSEIFMTYGYGDGGGGPTEEMLEYQRRICKGIIGLPISKLTSVGEALENVDMNIEKNKELCTLPKWRGELYLELHRGTYTSIASVKRYNRKSEFLLQNVEFLSMVNFLFGLNGYPSQKIKNCWKKILLNQFHDVLPGSSIKQVYLDAHRIYEQVLTDGNSIKNAMLTELAKSIRAESGDKIVINPNGFAIDGSVYIDGKCTYVGTVPALGWKVLQKNNDLCTVNVGDKTIENDYYKILFDENFDIVSIYDKINLREAVVCGKKANQFRMYEDLPYFCESWDICKYHEDKGYETASFVSAKEVYDGSRAGFEVVKAYKNSLIRQYIYCYSMENRIDFETTVDWHEHNVLLKVAFPVDVNTDEADYDIQFGSIKRKHTENSSWDYAKFEVCAHKWVDISDGGYGFALINDCKYGYSVVDDSTLQMSLIKCANSSDNLTVNDQGTHEFKYSVAAHSGDYREGGIVKKAYAFNNDFMTVEATESNGVLPKKFSFISAAQDNIIIETVKKAEVSDDIIIRMYEANNRKGRITLRCGFSFGSVYKCDLLENDICEIKDIDITEREVSMEISNYEIVTLKFKR